MHVTVVGAQWGDEGKGKVVDWLCERADCIVRFQGGNNAGHTLVVDGQVYKLSLLPSGVLRPGKKSLIASGVVVNPWVLLEEIDALQARGLPVQAGDLILCGGASLVLPFYTQLDAFREGGAGSIGTTRRGIGPAYEDRVGRRAIRVRDLLYAPTLCQKVARLAEHHDALRAGFGAEPINQEGLMKQLNQVGDKLAPFIGTSWRLITQWHADSKRILFEGAQGFWLDVDHGTYPYVTASNTHPCQAAVGCGIGRDMLGTVLGLTKAYTTRVGKGPFPTELHDATAHHLATRGKEFGTITGRARRCGWFDAVLTRQAVLMGGIQGIVLTKLDILDGLPELAICTAYERDGQRFDHWPYWADEELDAAPIKPIYEIVPGWSENTQGIARLDDYPLNARRYIDRIESLLGVPIMLISTSPNREDMIVLQDPYQ